MRRFRDASGFSLPELMIVIGIAGVIAGMAAFQMGSSLKAAKGDGAMRVVLAQLNTAREQAIAQRRIMLVKFLDPGVSGCAATSACMQTVRQELVGGPTVLVTVPFEGGVRYTAPPMLDTPDGFGKASAKDFGVVATSYGFTSDGTFIDGTAGTPLNGTVFLAIPNVTMSYRSVTVLGATGRVRAFRWNGRAWKLV